MLVVDNQTLAANVVQVITRVWNEVLEPDNLRSWRREIEVHFSEQTKSSDHSEFKLWFLGQNLVEIGCLRNVMILHLRLSLQLDICYVATSTNQY